MSRLSSEAIDRARDVRIEHVIEAHGIKLKGNGTNRTGPCPQCGGRNRFAVSTKKQVFNCRGCGNKGDVIALKQFLDGDSFREAVEELSGERPSNDSVRLRIVPSVEHKDDIEEYERQQHGKAKYLFRVSVPSSGSPVENYMLSRGITPPLPTTVRFLPALKPEHCPAMLIPFGLPREPEPGVLDISEDEVVAVQLLLLKSDGSGKADVDPNKITIASPAGMPMVLAPANDLLSIVITEGVEDALSVHRATGLGAWASGGWSAMPKLAATVPEYVEAVTVYADADEGGQRGARELAEALAGRGIEVFVEGLA